MRTMFLGAAIAAMGAVACGGGQQAAPGPGTASTTATTATAAPATTDTSAPPAGTSTPTLSLGDKMHATGMGMMQASNAHDADKEASFFTADAVLKVAGLPDASGRDAIKAHTQMGFTAFPDLAIAATRIWVKGNVAAVEWVMTGTMKGDLGPLKATGKQMGIQGISVTTYNDDGLVKEDHRYFDMHTEMQQLDPKAKPGTFRPVATLPTAAPEVHLSKGTPDEQSNTALVTSMYASMAPGKLDAFLALLTDDITWDDPGAPAPSSGKAAAKMFYNMGATAFPDGLMTPGQTIAADDFVVVEGVFTGTNKGAMPPMIPKATNKSISTHSVDVVQLKGGKIAHAWSYSNGYEFAQQLGMVPAPGAAH